MSVAEVVERSWMTTNGKKYGTKIEAEFNEAIDLIAEVMNQAPTSNTTMGRECMDKTQARVIAERIAARAGEIHYILDESSIIERSTDPQRDIT